MDKRHVHKTTFVVCILSIMVFTFFVEGARGESDPPLERYNLQAYSLDVDFCQDEAPKIKKLFRATKSGKGKRVTGKLLYVFEGAGEKDETCSISMRFSEEYPGEKISTQLTFEYAVDSDTGLIERGFYSGNPPVIKWTHDRPPLVSPSYDVTMGDRWGGAFTSRGKYIDCANCADISLSKVYEYSLVGVDDVSVPYGNFSDCLRIARFRGGMPDMIAWYCLGIGRVKMIYSDTGPYSRTFELVSVSISD